MEVVLDRIQTLLQSIEELDDAPLRTALRSLVEQVRHDATASNGPRTASLLGEDGEPGRFPLEPGFEHRYVLGERLGTGAMGEVYQAEDLRLRRTVAVKVMTADLLVRQSAMSRFLREARITGSLQHPGIVAIHDVGLLSDGRPFYAMREVKGVSLSERIQDVRDEAGGLRSLVGVVLMAAEAMAYAHSQGVIHRDLKPANLMVGEFGDVAVVDWGLARTVDEPDADVPVVHHAVEGYRTVTGKLAGSPAYMPPEQAAGTPVEASADVYALGASLWHVLAGEPPFTGLPSTTIIERLLDGAVPEPPVQGPEELRALCEWAMSPRPEDRPDDAGVFADALRDWVEGRRRHGRAEGEVRCARQALRRADRLNRKARRLERALASKQPAGPGEREQQWALEDELARLRSGAQLLEVRAAQHAQAALAHVPDDASARALLADYYAARHRAAELDGRRAEAEQLEVFLRGYDDGRYARYLRGLGAVTLCFDGYADATLHRVVESARRLVLEPMGRLPDKLIRKRLPIGSYVAEVRGDGGVFRVPFRVRREQHWDGVPPHGTETRPIRVPKRGELGAEERFVPAGWYQAGGDVLAANSEPAEWRWVGDFIMRAHPVTNAEYLAFLNDLVVRGLRHRAERYAPQPGPSGKAPYLFEPNARLRTIRDEVWRSDSPVLNVTYEAAAAFAAWVSENTGQWWRLPSEDEWEKAARGVDGRAYPMGPSLDAVHVNTDRVRGKVVSVFDHEEDASVYGVFGLAGNARTWCRPGRGQSDARLIPIRGGGFATDAARTRSAARDMAPAGTVRSDVGIRLVRAFR